jgi:hypothetical protein
VLCMDVFSQLGTIVIGRQPYKVSESMRFKPFFFVGMLVLGVVVIYIATSLMTGATATPPTGTSVKLTSTPQATATDSYLTEIPAKIVAYQSKYPLPDDIHEDFPLYPLHASALGLGEEGAAASDILNYKHCGYKSAGCVPWNYTGVYFISILKIAVPKDSAYIAVNYYYKKRMGGGQYAYASYYKWKIDYNFAVIYEIKPMTNDAAKAIQTALTGFNIEDGVFVLRRDGKLIRLRDFALP